MKKIYRTPITDIDSLNAPCPIMAGSGPTGADSTLPDVNGEHSALEHVSTYAHRNVWDTQLGDMNETTEKWQ